MGCYSIAGQHLLEKLGGGGGITLQKLIKLNGHLLKVVVHL